MRDVLERGLQEQDPAVTIFGAAAPRLGNTLCFAAESMSAETAVMALDLAGIAVSAGSACSSGKVKPSHVVSAMGFDAATAARAIRVSLGHENTMAEVDAFLAAWSRIGGSRIQAPRNVDNRVQPAA